MNNESINLYKIMILYMLSKVDIPLTVKQISDFITGAGYTDYLTLSATISFLKDNNFLTTTTKRNRTYLALTDDGENTLKMLKDNLSDSLMEDMNNYLKENKISFKEEYLIMSDYSKTEDGRYVATLTVKEQRSDLVNISITVPDEEMAIEVCDNWQKKNKDVYKYLVEQLL